MKKIVPFLIVFSFYLLAAFLSLSVNYLRASLAEEALVYHEEITVDPIKVLNPEPGREYYYDTTTWVIKVPGKFPFVNDSIVSVKRKPDNVHYFYDRSNKY